MTILRGDIIDWEPAVLTVTAPRKNSITAAEVSNFFRKWLLHREELNICPCFEKHLSVQQLSTSSVQIACEWLCDTCFEQLIKDLAISIPSVATIKLGRDWDQADEPEQRFIEIPPKTVSFEDGSTAEVPGLVISQQPVSIGDFEAFVFATNYVTTAQQQYDTENFREHFGLSGFSAKVRARMPATLLSYDDSQAYCKWAGLRLPSEKEVMSAALVDTRVYPDPSRDEDLGKQLRSKLRQSMKDGTAIEYGRKLTSTLDEGGVVVRSGPFPYLTAGWEQKANRHRKIVSAQFYDLLLEFHVCK